MILESVVAKQDASCSSVSVRKFRAGSQVTENISFAPSVVGLIVAREVIKDIVRR